MRYYGKGGVMLIVEIIICKFEWTAITTSRMVFLHTASLLSRLH